MLALLAAPAFAEPAVDIRAVGDSGFIAGNAQFGTPPPGWADGHLKAYAPLLSPDVNFINLEGAVTRSCRRFFEKEFMFAVAPETLIQFARMGFNLIGLANNHSQDCLDPPSPRESGAAQAVVRDAVPGTGMHGVASSPDALATPAIITVKGVRIGMVAMKAWPGGKGDNMGNFDNRHALMRALQDADVDVRILSLHGGTESARRPHDMLVNIAREFIGRFGGDVVFAHHPHVMQGMELMRKADGRAAAVFYSLGNFLHDGLSEKGDGVMAKLVVGKNGLDPDSVAVFPLANANTYPGPLARGDLANALAVLRSSSAAAQAKPLPAGLARLPFSFKSIYEPAPGAELVAGAVSTPNPAPPIPKARKKASWEPPHWEPARWIPPEKH
jgi:poly-gamma-glutamate synthesis protein (capsule biosynthesis protein)